MSLLFRLLERFSPWFSPWWRRPRTGRGCSFRNRGNIRLGRRVRILRGSVVLADTAGTIELGGGVVVCRYCVVQSVGGSVRIGENTLIGDFCSLYGQGGLSIGREVMLAAGVRVVPDEHTFAEPGVPVSRQPTTSQGIEIGDGAWLATNVVVTDGVRIGHGAVVGAGSVVTRSIPDFAVAAGVPARVLRMRPGHEPDA